MDCDRLLLGSDTLLKGGTIMEDQTKQPKNDKQPGDIARRDLVALSVAAGLAATAGVGRRSP